MAQPLFGSEATVEDVAEAFWRWPQQKLVGDEWLRPTSAQSSSLGPGPRPAPSYSLVRSWIAPDIALPLRIEKFGKDGRLLKRFIVAKIVKQGPGSWAAAILIVDSADGKSRTTLEGTRSDRDLAIPAEQFTLEAIKQGLSKGP